MHFPASGFRWLLLLPLAVGIGCGPPPYHPVSGTITLDNRPLEGAFISFMPEGDRGVPSFGNTDAAGRYTLTHGAELQGAPAGEYRVRISTYKGGNDEVDPPIPAKPERIPSKYNLQTDLLRTVAPGPNEFNFELDSRGEIIQPE